MFSPVDTIVAVATPLGQAGMGVIRLSGPDARAIAAHLLHLTRPLSPRLATLSRVRATAATAPDADRVDLERPAAIDQAIALYFPAPASYTGEDVVEISAHGSPVVMQLIVDAGLQVGARLAEPGEFTLRAFLNGRMDLVQAEAVRDLIEAVTPLQARVAFDQLEGTLTERVGEIDGALFDLIARLEASLDFPDEGYHFVQPSTASSEIAQLLAQVQALTADGERGRVIREGRQVVIVGRPNVGKSTLFNALVGADRAIVTKTPGTTRDLVTERLDVEGVPLTLVDTAGVRQATDEIESEGVKRTRGAIGVADALLVVLDRSQRLTDEDIQVLESTASRPRVVVGHKDDLPCAWPDGETGPNGLGVCAVSSLTGAGLADLRMRLVRELGADRIARDGAAVTNVRHLRLLEEVRASLGRAQSAAKAEQSEEFVLSDLEGARAALESITGKRTSEDLLRHIFSNFCVGK